jgi:uncharacterized membrane protein YqjE
MSDSPGAEANAIVSEVKPRGPQLLKGCGCITGLLVMALGILVIGNFDDASWASAIIATVVGILVFVLSGVNGFWER